MRKNYPIIEDGVIAGNVYNKYGTRNPIARFLMKGFLDSINSLISMTNSSDVHEIGCGEGHLSIAMTQEKIRVRASDYSQKVVNEAQNNAKSAGVNIHFKVASIYDMIPGEDAAELIVCCEVLEHLEEPQRALHLLTGLARPYLIVSVPREPLWRVLNIARGKYIGSLGNTPGHVQHWNKKRFLLMLSEYVDIIKVLSPLPWVMVLCRSRKEYDRK